MLVVAFVRTDCLAVNPFLQAKDSEPVVSKFTGVEWNDEFAPEDIRLTGRGVTQRVAQMPWGAVFRISFDDLKSKAPEKREIRTLHFVATDDVIALLNETDMDKAIRKVAALEKPPRFEDRDLYGISKGTKKFLDHPAETTISVKGDLCTYAYRHNSGHFTRVVWKKGDGLVEYAAGYGARRDGYSLKREAVPRASQRGSKQKVRSALFRSPHSERSV